jgi:L-malate glycosyltransferase
VKILQIIQTPQLRGAEIFTCQISEELMKQGHQVDVAYLFERETFDLDFKVNFIPLHGSKKKRFYDLAAYRRLADLIRSHKYDLIQANAGDTLKYAVLSKLIFRWKQKLVFRNANRMSAFITGLPSLLLNRFLLRQVDYVISVSENCRQDIIQLYPALRQRSETLLTGTYDYGGRAQSQDSSNGPIILNISSFVAEKNHPFLFKIFKAFREKHHTGELWLVGHGPLGRKYEDLVAEIGIQEHVKFWGYRKDAIQILKQADVLLLPSLIEGLPAAILESFSCEVPVLASAVGGIPEAIENEKNGICIKGWSEGEYLAALEKILFDKEFRANQVQEAKRRFHELFDVTKVSRGFEKAYRTLLNH